jgi:hypothetical protein
MYSKKKLNEIEMKMPKLRNISISQIPTKPDQNYKQIIIVCINIRYLYSLNVKLFTNEVDLVKTTKLTKMNHVAHRVNSILQKPTSIQACIDPGSSIRACIDSGTPFKHVLTQV